MDLNTHTHPISTDVCGGSVAGAEVGAGVCINTWVRLRAISDLNKYYNNNSAAGGAGAG
jgi:hypothetical protein